MRAAHIVEEENSRGVPFFSLALIKSYIINTSRAIVIGC